MMSLVTSMGFANEDVVDGRCDHPRLWIKPVDIVERCLFSHLVKDFQQETESEVPRH